MTADILIKAQPWMQQCGYCDAGLPTGCSCPRDDSRPIVAELCTEVERLRADAAAFEARVRAELAGEIAEALDAEAVKLVAAQSPQMASVFYAAATIARSRAIPREDTPPKVKLITHWLPFSVEAENHPFTGEQRSALAGHEGHQTAGSWSAFGWRELRCSTCDKSLWSVGTPREDS